MNRNQNIAPLEYDCTKEDLCVELGGKLGLNVLRVNFHRDIFSLSLPDNTVIADELANLDRCLQKVKETDRKLFHIIKATIRSHKLRIDMEKEWKSVDLPFEGQRYRLDINPYNGRLKLFMPEYMILADRSKLIDSFSEILRMEQGTIQNILIDQVVEVQPIRVSNSDMAPKSTLPIRVVRPNEYLIGKYYYRVQYIFERVACFVHVPDRAIETNCRDLVHDIPEIEDLQGDKLLYAIVNEVDKYGLKISKR